MKRLFRWIVAAIGAVLLIGTVLARPPQQENLFQLFLQNLRNDIELIADNVYGGIRPDGWNGTTDLESPSMLADLWVDNEILADEVFGSGTRPDGWIGATSSNVELVSRNVRHDLELTADNVYGDFRPDEWEGARPLYRCDRTVMNLVYVLDIEYGLLPSTPESVIDYCATVAAELETELVPQAIGQPEDVENVPAQILAIRGDLERLADEELGLNNRPAGWVGNKDINSPDLAGDIFADLGLLADELLGRATRPPGWIGAFSGEQIQNLRTLRFDLELLADSTLGEDVRPRGWQGDNQLLRCSPITQNALFIVEQLYGYEPPDPTTTTLVGDEYCNQVDEQANELIENPPVEEEIDIAVDERFVAESRLAFSYLDKAATQYMGKMPWGVEFRAWYRNFGGSTMMFVSGNDFALYIDRRWTTLSDEAFDLLPTLEGVRPLTFCDADWCNGPGPTPTPTGDGPLLEIVVAGTPTAAPDPTDFPDEAVEPRIVSWNNIRVNYLLQRPDVGRTQVTLELCRDPNQLACEPVTRVVNNTTGEEVPVVSRFNGLNVYELPYGYSTNFTIESANFISNDIWLNDPAATGG
jgi:hypothetical protein